QQIVKEAFCKGPVKARCKQPVVHAPRMCVGLGAALKGASLGRKYRTTGFSLPVIVMDYAASRELETSLRLEIPEDGPESLEGGSCTMTAQSGRKSTGEILSPKRALVENIPLNPEQANHFKVDLKDRAGQPVSQAQITIYHNPNFVEPLGLNTSANVLSYAISLEVYDTAQRSLIRHTLAEKLTPLPCFDLEHTFNFPTGAEVISLPVYGDSQLIKTIQVPVMDDIPAGAEVTLRISIDANQKLQCQGHIPQAVRNQHFDFSVDSPEPEPVPTLADFKKLEAKAYALMGQVGSRPGFDKQAVRLMQLLQDVDRAFDNRDEAKIIQRMRELNDLLDEWDPSNIQLEPPVEELDKLANETLSILSVLSPNTTVDGPETAKNVEANRHEAKMEAKQNPPDVVLYTRCYKNIETDHDLVLDEYRRQNPPDPKKTATNLIDQAEEKLPQAQAAAQTEEQRRHVGMAEECLNEARKELAADNYSRAVSSARNALQLVGQVLVKTSMDDPAPGKERVLETGTPKPVAPATLETAVNLTLEANQQLKTARVSARTPEQQQSIKEAEDVLH
ncbi:MAG: hypothetical protein KDA84_22300, partial [Planctomycetaceae bacterium]|nr:hypothetical protein [Planctomycetaceae bacterium]